MSKHHQIIVAPVTVPLRRPRRLLTMGSHAGARANIAALKKLNDELPGEYDPMLYGDAVGAHAERVAREAKAAGVPARAITVATQELPRLPLELDGLIVQLDRPEAQLAAFEFAVSRGIPVLVYALIAPPRGLPLGIMSAFTADELDSPSAADFRLIQRTLGPITSRRGASSVTEGDEVAEARVVDIRARFRDHLHGVMRKVAANLTPEVAPIVATDGERVSPVVVLASGKWSTPFELEERVLLERRDLVIEPGSRLMVAETLSGEQPELRLHDIVFRRSDRRLGTRGSRTLSAGDFAPLPPAPPPPGAATRALRRRDEASVVDALVGLAMIAMVFGAMNRLQPARSTD